MPSRSLGEGSGTLNVMLPPGIRQNVEAIIDRALYDDDGAPYWLRLDQQNAHRVRVTHSGWDLYQGSAGILVMLARLRGLSRRIQGMYHLLLSSFVRRFSDGVDTDEWPIGAFSGSSGLAYAAVLIAKQDGGNLRELRKLGLSIVHSYAEAIENDKHYDVMSGSAGALLSITAMHKSGFVTPGFAETIVKRIFSHLADAITIDGGGLSGWPIAGEGIILGGFSHGFAGFACAATRGLQVAESPAGLRVLECAQGGQLALWDQRTRTFRDLRGEGTPGQSAAVNSWCHGSDGILIGLSDDCVTARSSLPGLSADVATSYPHLEDPGGISLCHGAAGRLGALHRLESVGLVTREMLAKKSVELQNVLRSDLVDNRSWRTYHEDPSLMLGMAGSLLATVDPGLAGRLLAVDV